MSGVMFGDASAGATSSENGGEKLDKAGIFVR